MVQDPPCNAGGVGSIPGGGTKIPPAEKQPSPGPATADIEHHSQTVLALRGRVSSAAIKTQGNRVNKLLKTPVNEP